MERAADGAGIDVVGVRELRQNLSVYLDRIRTGQAFTVTDRGQPVAMLVPLRRGASTMERLVASGRANRPVGDLVALGRPPGRASARASRLLQAMRDEDRW